MFVRKDNKLAGTKFRTKHEKSVFRNDRIHFLALRAY